MSSGPRNPSGLRGARKRVLRGDRVAIKASDLNVLMDIAARERSSLGVQNAEPLKFAKKDGIFVRFENTTSEPFLTNEIVALYEPIFKPAKIQSGGSGPITGHGLAATWRDRVAMRARKPTANDRGKFGIVTATTMPNTIGIALISGLVLARVEILAETDWLADIKADEQTMLQSAAWGSAKILWKDAPADRLTASPKIAWAVLHIGGPVHFTNFRAEVIDVDTSTWGAGRKKLKVKRLVRHPRGIDGPEFVCDGGIDTLIGCGDQVLVQEAQYVFGDPIQDQYPPLVATPITAHDQSNMPQPDPTATAFVPTPGLPLLPDLPCTSP